jgi:hypothetical protein
MLSVSVLNLAIDIVSAEGIRIADKTRFCGRKMEKIAWA